MEIINTLQQLRPAAKVNTVYLEDGHNLNSLWLAYGMEGVRELINTYHKETTASQLEFTGYQKIRYAGKAATYFVVGHLPNDLTNMRVALQIVDNITQNRHRIRTDLYDFNSVQFQCQQLTEKQGMDYNLLETDLSSLTNLLEQYRDSLFEAEENPVTDTYSKKELLPSAQEKAVEFLSSPNLLENMDNLLEKAGIVGEEGNRISLFVIASSYKMPNPLHAMLQGTSGGGKSHLVNAISQCMPQEDVKDFTRITSKSLYHYKEQELVNKLIIIQDFDGLDEDAEYAFREMQSNKQLSSSTVVKDRFGNTTSRQKVVKGHFASLVATTKTDVYIDNLSRSVVLGIDESTEQTQRIIQRQNQRRMGIASIEDENEARQLLRNCIRMVRKYEVINPYADRLTLPLEARTLRRLNSQYQDFIEQVTLLHQYQRETDDKGRLITTKADIEMATDIFFTAILLKIDELDASTRQFFEQMKSYIKTQPAGTTYKFTQREVRHHTTLGKTQVAKYFLTLQELEYIQIVEGSANTGFKYRISYWDNMDKVRAKVKESMREQLNAL